MTIALDSNLEPNLRERADSQCLSVSAYVQRLVTEDQNALDELIDLAATGLSSGEAVVLGPDYWRQQHDRLDANLKSVQSR